MALPFYSEESDMPDVMKPLHGQNKLQPLKREPTVMLFSEACPEGRIFSIDDAADADPEVWFDTPTKIKPATTKAPKKSASAKAKE